VIDDKDDNITITYQADFLGGQIAGMPPYWITAIHTPTMQSVRVYSKSCSSQYKARNKAVMLLSLLLEDTRQVSCRHPEIYEEV